MFLMFDHTVSMIISLVLVAIILALYFGYPCLQYISLVSRADTVEGKEDLAKHLAHKAGGKVIHVSKTWQDFLPAAHGLHDLHLRRKLKLFFKEKK